MRMVEVEGRLIPLTRELPVVRPVVPPLILSAAVLPIVFPLIVIEAAAPETLIPVILPATAAVVPLQVNEPNTLFWIEMVPVDDELIPTSKPPEVVAVAVKEPVPDVAPIVLPEAVPILALPDVTFIPHKIPFTVVAPLLVVMVIEAMVLFSIVLTALPAVNAQFIPIYLSATVEFRVIVPVAVVLE